MVISIDSNHSSSRNLIAFPKATNNTSLVEVDVDHRNRKDNIWWRERFEGIMALLSLSVINIKPQIDRSWVRLASLEGGRKANQ